MTAGDVPASVILNSAPYAQYHNLAAYEAAAPARDAAWLRHTEYEQKVSDDICNGHATTIWCPVCGEYRRISFTQPINWREDGVCEGCTTNARMRFSLGLMQALIGARVDARVFLTEQLTRSYAIMRHRFSRTMGSEYIPEATTRRKRQHDLDHLLGKKWWHRREDRDCLRHEDVTRLSFLSGEFDLVGCFDVLEHVPNYRRAVQELWRVLNANGVLVLTAPFIEGAPTTLERARIDDAGKITYLCPPEYHTSSIAGERHLCYYHFGWDLLDFMRKTGFSDVSLVTCWSADSGIFGAMNALVAFKHPTE